MKARLLFACALALTLACATSPTGRQQLIFVPDSVTTSMGVEAYSELKKSTPVDKSMRVNAYVRCIVDPLIRTLDGDAGNPSRWEVTVFENNDANAFALPGGKIGVYTGLLRVATSDAQLAAVLGHEIGHVLARHGAERLSQQVGTQAGLAALGALTENNPNRDMILGLLGVGVQVGVLLPFSRTQESEADLIGLDLMAKAGFNPEASVQLWHNMMAASGGKAPPEWLSTHPANQTRINTLTQNMPAALQLYQRAKAQGHTPHCTR